MEEHASKLAYIPRDSGMFSLCLRSLYAEKAVGTNEDAARKFRKLRDETRNDAMVYLEGILPVSTKFVTAICPFFERYDALTYEQWSEKLKDIHEETVGYLQMCQTVKEMHEEILVPLKKRKDQANLVVQELKELKEEFETKKRDLGNSANKKADRASGLSFIPIVNLIATPIFFAESDKDMANAVAKGDQAKIQEAAAITVQYTLIPALESFIGCLQKATGFFLIIEQEFKKFEEKYEKSLEAKKKLQYKVMREWTQEMYLICQKIIAILPVVKTDLLAIPTKGTDQDYVGSWLMRLQKMIEKNCTAGNVASQLIQAITGRQMTENIMEELASELAHMPRDLGMFSLCLRSLYAEKAVRTNEDVARKFRKLRDETRNDAMVYLKGILPVSTKFVTAISEFFEYYDTLNYKQWCEELKDLHEETVGYLQMCQMVKEMHEEILVPLKKRKDQANLVVQELKELKEEFETKKRELENSANKKANWALGLFFIPIVNLIATPILFAERHKDFKDAVAKGDQAKIQEAAALTVQETLIPALESFIGGLEKAVGFFSIMEQEFVKFEGKADQSLEAKKELHYNVMRKEAKKMDVFCQNVFAMLPVVKTDLLAIPTEGTDQNYVDRWLMKLERRTEKKYTAGNIAN